MTGALAKKLQKWADLSDEDHATLEALGGEAETVERHQQLIREGDDPTAVFLLLEGWAFRYKILPDGKRQIVAFLLPGDLCDIHIFILDRMDHGISMLSGGKVVRIAREEIIRTIDAHPAVSRALWWATLVDEAVLREWLVNIGARDAYTRVAHILCELYVRMENVGLVSAGEIHMPMTQTDLADALGLTPIHINRMLRRFRADGMITFKARLLTIHDVAGLKAIAGFDPGYLHGRKAKRGLLDGAGADGSPAAGRPSDG